MKKLTLILGALLLAMTACTAKKRDNALPYGADRNLLKISDYDGAEFDLVTDSVQAKSASNTSDVKIMDETGNVQYHNFVTYKTKAELMDNSPFIGKPAHTYKVKYILEDKKLKIYKVGQEKDFSFEEKAAAQSTKLPDGRLAVPLVGYSVSYYSTDNSRNENNEVTPRLELVDQETKASAAYFRIEKSSKELAEIIKKDLHFDSHFFDGEWYFATSVVSQNYIMKAGVDRFILEGSLRSDSTKVKVKKEENRLSFYSLKMDSKIKGTVASREENQKVVLSFPAAWKQYRMSPAGRGTSVREQEDNSKAWDQRAFVKLDPSKISMPTLKSSSGSDDEEDSSGSNIKSEMNAELRDVQIGEEHGRRYLSFLVFMPQAKTLVRYAFLEAKPRNDIKAYEPKIYLKEDRKIFGFFSTDIRPVMTRDRMNESDFLNNHMVNRFNPNMSVIQFNPSEQTPDWTMKIAEKAVQAWNGAFQSAGTGIKIEFNKTKVHVGDIRYNIINIVDDPDGNDPWWGFGPSIADVETGEIISATANMNMSTMVHYTRALIRSYIRTKAGELAGDFVTSVVLAGTDMQVSRKSGVLQITTDHSVRLPGISLSPQILKGAQENARYLPVFNRSLNKGFEWLPVKTKNKYASLESAFNGRLPESNFQLEYENITREIQENSDCAAVREYTGKLKGSADRTSRDDENKIIESCAHAILEPRAVATLVHELGHNFGLRHNFYGNTDQSNFWPAAAGKTPARSSSIMEYPHIDEDTLVIPGFYDVAAIKWGYTNKLFNRDGVSDVAADQYKVGLPIKAQPAAATMRQFKYCTDEQAQGLGYDPMCALHDKGTTAIETVSSFIKGYNYSLAGLRNLEKGRILALGAQDSAQQNIETVFVPVKRYYDYFRLLIEQEYPSHGYLDTEDAKSFPLLIEAITQKLQKDSGLSIDYKKMKRDELSKVISDYYKKGMTPNQKKFIEFLDYQAASNLAYNFLKSVAFMPDYYCMVNVKDETESMTTLISFAILQRDIFNSSGITVTSCKDQATLAQIAKMGATYILDVGNPVDTLVRELNVTNAYETPVALGTMYDRAGAAMVLSARGVTLEQNLSTNILPNFYDEPAKRAELEQLIIDRMVKGVDSKTLGIDAKLKELGIKDFQSLVFEAEKPLINYMYITMVQGELVPGKSFVNSKRLERFQLHRAYLPDQLRAPGVKQFSYQGAEFYALPENEVIYKLIDSAHELVELRQKKVPDQKSIEAIKKFAEGRLPSMNDKNAKFTIEDYNNFVSAFKAEAAKDPILAKGEDLMQEVIAPESEIMSAILKPIGEALIAGGNKPDDIKKAAETVKILNVIEAAKKMKKEFNLYKETIGERIDSELEDLVETIMAYKLNENELNAQTDMLIQAITLTGE